MSSYFYMPMPGDDPDYVQGSNEPWYKAYLAAQKKAFPRQTTGAPPPVFSGSTSVGPVADSQPSGSSYQDLYQMAVNSPWYQQGLAASQAASAADKASGRSAIQQMLIQFGVIPEGFNDQFGAIDDTIRGLADANTKSGISAYSRMRQSLADANRDASRRLAARGLRRSGTRGYRLRRNQLGFDQGYADSISQLLGNAQGIYSGFANNEYTRSMNLANLLSTAIGNMSNFYTPTTQSLGSSAGDSVSNYLGMGSQNQWQGYVDSWLADRAQNGTGGFL